MKFWAQLELEFNYRVSKKNYHFMFCLISQKPWKGITNNFFLLKTDLHTQILSTKPFLCDTRGLRYL